MALVFPLAVGAASGWLVRKLPKPFFLTLMPDGIAAGVRYQFCPPTH